MPGNEARASAGKQWNADAQNERECGAEVDLIGILESHAHGAHEHVRTRCVDQERDNRRRDDGGNEGPEAANPALLQPQLVRLPTCRRWLSQGTRHRPMSFVARQLNTTLRRRSPVRHRISSVLTRRAERSNSIEGMHVKGCM